LIALCNQRRPDPASHPHAAALLSFAGQAPWVEAEHALCVPKLRLTLSSTISSSPKSGKLVAVIASSALAVAALIAGVAAPSALADPSARSAAAAAAGPAGTVAALRQVRVATAVTQAGSTPPVQQTPQQIARKMLRSFGWTGHQFKYLNLLWEAESSWNVSAENPSTGAYGIPQAVPGAKMSAAGPDWQTDVTTQVRWGLGYISAAYGSPRAAWEHEVTYGWY
jgi:hypothetical protein